MPVQCVQYIVTHIFRCRSWSPFRAVCMYPTWAGGLTSALRGGGLPQNYKAKTLHWGIKGDAPPPGTCPPSGQFFLNFMPFSGKFNLIYPGAPSPRVGAPCEDPGSATAIPSHTLCVTDDDKNGIYSWHYCQFCVFLITSLNRNHFLPYSLTSAQSSRSLHLLVFITKLVMVTLRAHCEPLKSENTIVPAVLNLFPLESFELP